MVFTPSVGSSKGCSTTKGVFILDIVRVLLEAIGALTILKYAIREGKQVIAEAGNFACTIRKAIQKVKNSS